MASPNVAFDTIPSTFRKPLTYAEFNTKLALHGLPANLLPMVIVAPKLASGTLPVNTPTPVFSTTDGDNYGGIGSVAAQMVRAALKANPYLSLTLVVVAEAANAVAATGTCTLTGTPTASGVLSIDIGSQILQVPVLPTDTPATLAAEIATAINNTPQFGLTASVAQGVVTLTTAYKGTLGNNVDVVVDASAAPGMAASAIVMSGASLDPDITATLASIFTAGHKIIATAFADSANLATLRTHVDTVSNSVELRGAVAWFGATGTLGQATTRAAALNDGRMYQALYRGTTSNPWQLAAAMAAVDAGETDPAMPLNTLALTGVAVCPVTQNLLRAEQESLLYNGVTPIQTGPGGVVQVVRAISTYTVNPSGAPDISLLDRTTIKTLDYFRDAVVNDQRIRFGRSKLTTIVLMAVRTRAIEIALQLQDLQILRNVDQFKDQFVCEIDSQNPSQLNLRVPSPVVPGLQILASRFDLYLSF